MYKLLKKKIFELLRHPDLFRLLIGPIIIVIFDILIVCCAH